MTPKGQIKPTFTVSLAAPQARAIEENAGTREADQECLQLHLFHKLLNQKFMFKWICFLKSTQGNCFGILITQ